jgi:hypothetical protein
MSTLQSVFLGGMLGPAYLLISVIAGAAFMPAHYAQLSSAWDRVLLQVLMGTLVHALIAALVLGLDPGLNGIALWMTLGVAIAVLALRRRRPLFEPPLLVLFGLYAVCYALLVSYHFSPARGPTLFWSLYGLTGVTPGDSPQGAFQAQFLIHGSSLLGGGEFSLFDRPFLGGLITADALGAFGVRFSSTFYDYSLLTQLGYASLWIGVNGIAAVALLSLVHRFAQGRAAYLSSLLVVSCPMLILNILGLWPKLYALAWLWAACVLAFSGRPLSACLLSGVAFYAHGSFLWSHISFCGVMVFYLLAQSWRTQHVHWSTLAGTLAACMFFPAVWFTSEHLFGGESPLRQYYLYNVPVTEGFHRDAAEIASNFYGSTSASSLALIPWMNLAKGALPLELLDIILNFRLDKQPPSWRDLGEALFRLQFLRSVFALGLCGGIVAICSLSTPRARRWLPRLALVAFLLLPLIPGLGLYRRDDHFLLPVMLFASIPVVIHFCIGLQRLPTRVGISIALCMLLEYLMVYFWRIPPVSYQGEFVHYYRTAVIFLVAAVAALALLPPWRILPLPGSRAVGDES